MTDDKQDPSVVAWMARAKVGGGRMVNLERRRLEEEAALYNKEGFGGYDLIPLSLTSDLTAMKAELEEAKKERDALRVIISECATAVGAGIATTASIEFMALLPGEIKAVISRHDETRGRE